MRFMFAWSLTTFLLLGCSSDKDNARTGEPPPPVFKWSTPDTFVVQKLGEPVTYTLTVTTPDGSPYPAEYSKDISFPRGENPQTVMKNPSPGVYEISVSPSQVDEYVLTVHVGIFARPGEPVSGFARLDESPQLFVDVWGGAALDLSPDVGSLELAVGELRPVDGVGVAPLSGIDLSEQSVIAGDDVELEVEDTSIARIGAKKVLEGVAPGSTGLLFHAGERVVRVPVTVTSKAKTSVPPESFVRFNDEHTSEPMTSIEPDSGAADGTIGVDPNGAPVFAVKLKLSGVRAQQTVFKGGQRGAGIRTWTGTGYGIERISAPWEDVTNTHVTVDEKGHIYAVFGSTTRGRFILVDRPGEGPFHEWRRRELDSTLDEMAGVGDSKAYQEELPHTQPVLIPKPGGGVYVSYADTYEFRTARTLLRDEAGNTIDCSFRVKLVEVEGDELRTKPVYRTDYRYSQASDCVFNYRLPLIPDPVRQLVLLPAASGEEGPTVVVAGTPLHAVNGEWVENTALDFQPSTNPDVPPPVAWALSGPGPVPSATGWYSAEVIFGQQGLASPKNYANCFMELSPFANPMSTRAGDYLIGAGPKPRDFDVARVGSEGRCVSPMSVFRPPGGSVVDFLDTEYLRGLQGSPKRLYGLYEDSGSLAIASMPVPQTPDGTGDLPSRIVRPELGPWDVVLPPVLTDDGSAVVITEGYTGNPSDAPTDAAFLLGGVFSASGPAAPFTHSGERPGFENSESAPLRLRVLGSDIYAFAHDVGGLRVSKSTDLGTSWSSVALLPAAGVFSGLEAEVFPTGEAFAAITVDDVAKVYVQPSVAAPSAFTELSAGAVPFQGKQTRAVKLIQDGEELVRVGLGSGVTVHRYSRTGELLSATQLVLSAPGFSVSSVLHAVLDSQGRVVLLNRKNEAETVTLRLLRPGATDTTTLAVFEGLGTDSFMMEKLADGRFALVAQRAVDAAHTRVFGAISSDDGATFGDELPLLIDRGPYQVPLGVAQNGTELLVLAKDTWQAGFPAGLSHGGRFDFQTVRWSP
ncbi:MAG TPA: hypothetical protein VM694_03645 [Polyangium sp.]|nr:hypothetical protein [Polyangium sp.]